MDIAIVTGAETPLGLRIIEGLIRQGCRVHGIGNNLSKVTFADSQFIAHAIDVSDLEAITRKTSEILEKEGALHILIHAIDVTPGAAFEKLPVGNLEAILKIGLLGPVMLTRLALPNLLRFRGQLINIIPANKGGHTASAINALIEGGLREMNNALFDHARDAGLRVTNLILRQNPQFPAADVSNQQLSQTRIDPEHVARTIEHLLNENEPNVPNEITLYPRLSAQAPAALPTSHLPIDPYNAIVLPPAEYCPPKQEKIKTKTPDRIERTIPYSDEEMEDKIAAAIEDFETHPERYEAKEPTPRRDPRPQPNNDAPHSQSEGDASSKRRRGRRRGGRNRNRDRDDKNQGHGSQQQGNAQHQPQGDPQQSSNADPRKQSKAHDSHQKPRDDQKPREHPKRDNQPDRNGPKAQDSQKASHEASTKREGGHASESGNKPRNRRRGGPKPEHFKEKRSEASNSTQATPSPRTEAPKQALPAQQATPKPAPSDKPVKKKAAKKAAKKATKKTATKKAPAKKAVKKVATKKAAKKATKKRATKKAAKKAPSKDA